MTHPKSSRRDFLAGKSAQQALEAALAPAASPLPALKTVGAEPGSHLLSVSREAMACLFEVVFDAATYRQGAEVAVEALALVAALEEQLTVYRETSEVAQINRRAAEGPVAAEAGLFGLLGRAASLMEATQGAFDITTGRLTKVWGFYRRQGQMPSRDEVAAALCASGRQHLVLGEAERTVRFERTGLELNLGAIGKGHALDRAAAALVAGGIDSFLIHGGNSSVLANGAKSGETGWTVALRHPQRPDVRLAEFVLTNQALGTSGSGTQFFHHQGKRYGHILDPRTGWPADKCLSATVIAPTAEESDALSTALYVLGVAEARAFCAAHPSISALLVTEGQAAGQIELHPLNLADHQWRQL